jgi:integrase
VYQRSLPAWCSGSVRLGRGGASKRQRNDRAHPSFLIVPAHRESASSCPSAGLYRLSRVVGVKKTAYDMRHGFATRKLVQGHDHLTIAELMGHRDGTMLAKVYAHLDRNDAHLKKALAD